VFVLKCDLRIGVKSASEDLSLVIFRQTTVPSPGISCVRKIFPTLVRAMDHSLGILFTQKNAEGAKKTIYYLSRLWSNNPVEKECLALVLAIQKTRHYLVEQTIHVIFRVNPLRILMTKSDSLNSRLANWAILLS